MKTSPRTPPGHVRIIGGHWRGTKLPVVDVPGLRPSSDRVRETVFNWLQPVLPGARVLDLFAGTGAFGLEALSRGAREAFLVERDARACEALRAAARRLDAGEAARIVQADAQAWLEAPVHGRFDIVFADPPFAAGGWDAVVARLDPWVSDAAWLYLEMPPERAPALPPPWQLHRAGRTREAGYHLARRGPWDGAGTQRGG